MVQPPVNYPPFVDFCCGKAGEAEHEVNRTVRRLWAGTNMEQQIAVVLTEQETHRYDDLPCLVGVCGVGARVLEVDSPIPGLANDEAGGYIVAIGIDGAYWGRKLVDGSRPGNALMEAALRVVEQALPGSRMPFVKAKILPDNGKSSRLFDEHGFDDLGPRRPDLGSERDVFRPPGLDFAFRRAPTWSVAIGG